MAYYNAAIVFKRENNLDKAIEWYKKAIEVNPRYSYALNNLGNIYKTRLQYEEAIKCYKQAVEHLSTYTLCLANMGVCYLKLGNYREAFNAMERAKECLPTDNNNLSAGNKGFLTETLAKFEVEGESWRENGCITAAQREKLRNLINCFERKFIANDHQEKEPVSVDKVFKKEILEIVKLVKVD
jgi:tetratricopeptide (TPR) repeat protein